MSDAELRKTALSRQIRLATVRGRPRLCRSRSSRGVGTGEARGAKVRNLYTCKREREHQRFELRRPGRWVADTQMTSGREKQAAQKTPKSPMGAETFGGVCYAAVVTKELDSDTLPLIAPGVGSYDDGIEVLKSDTRRQLLGKPAPGKLKAVEVSAKTGSSSSVSGHLEVLQMRPVRRNEEAGTVSISEKG